MIYTWRYIYISKYIYIYIYVFIEFTYDLDYITIQFVAVVPVCLSIVQSGRSIQGCIDQSIRTVQILRFHKAQRLWKLRSGTLKLGHGLFRKDACTPEWVVSLFDSIWQRKIQLTFCWTKRFLRPVLRCLLPPFLWKQNLERTLHVRRGLWRQPFTTNAFDVSD